MLGYQEVRQLIISALMGRPEGTEIQPENHQEFALAMLDYTKQVEQSAGGSVIIGYATPTTEPLEPTGGYASYLSSVSPGQTATYVNFIGENGNPISITAGANTSVIVFLIWNGTYWSANTMNVVVDPTGTETAVKIQRDFGMFDAVESVPLSVGTSGKFVDVNGVVQNNANYAISAPVTLTGGKIYLFKSTSAVANNVSIASRKVVRSYDKVIDYAYTYDGEGRIATATADYDATLVYTYTYDSEGHATIRDKDNVVVASLPATHPVTDEYYEPLMRGGAPSIPNSGYYLIPVESDMTVVVSGLSADFGTGKNLLGVLWGVIAFILQSTAGFNEMKAIALGIAQAFADTKGAAYRMENGGNERALTYDVLEEYRRNGVPIILYGNGAPAVNNVPLNWDAEKYGTWIGIPSFIGQQYIDISVSSEGLWYGRGTTSVGDWCKA